MTDHTHNDRPTDECNTATMPDPTVGFEVKIEVTTHSYQGEQHTRLVKHGNASKNDDLNQLITTVLHAMTDQAFGPQAQLEGQDEPNEPQLEDQLKLYYAAGDGNTVKFRHHARHLGELMSMLQDLKIRVANGRSGYIVVDEAGKQVFISSLVPFIGEA
jgi:hypothetical protein